MGLQGLFYDYHTLSKALTLYEMDHDWHLRTAG